MMMAASANPHVHDNAQEYHDEEHQNLVVQEVGESTTSAMEQIEQSRRRKDLQMGFSSIALVLGLATSLFVCPWITFCATMTAIASCCLYLRNNTKDIDQPARCKSVLIPNQHPSWLVWSTYSGSVAVWKHDENRGTQYRVSLDKLPIRACAWLESKNWMIVGMDPGRICVFTTTTGDKVTEWEAHSDYIRALTIAPSQPYLLSCSDDMTVKMWDIEYNFEWVKTFEGHNHYIMALQFDPHNHQQFATASLDRTIKFWNLERYKKHPKDESNPSSDNCPTNMPLFTLKGHSHGVNDLDFYQGDQQQPLLATGSDDHAVFVWNIESRQVLHILEGHTQNVTAVLFHPTLPILVSTSEDHTVRFWDTRHNFTSLMVLDCPDKGRGWALAAASSSNNTNGSDHHQLAVGFDTGCYSMDLVMKNISSNNNNDADDDGRPATSHLEIENDINVSKLLLEHERIPMMTTG